MIDHVIASIFFVGMVFAVALFSYLALPLAFAKCIYLAIALVLAALGGSVMNDHVDYFINKR